jgi:alpha-1,3-mannosyltransferase
MAWMSENSPPVPSKTIIALNRFSTNKRLDRLIAFLAALRRRDPEWKLAIAGSESELSAADLRALAERHGVSQAVEVIVGPSDEQIRQAMSRCSVLGSASEYEAFGIAAIEGLSAGLLPLLSDIPSFRDLVRRTGVGAIVDFDHPDRAVEAFLAEWAQWSRS